MQKVVIVGGVAAGATAAAKVRRISTEAEITILEAGPDISFANCGLPYYIGGDIKSRSKLILQSPESFNDQYQTAVHINTSATKIDRVNKVVSTVNQQTGEKKDFEYTKLILAQGGKPIVPPLKGADQDNVFQLWTLADMDKIDNFIRDNKPKTAVVVGGGFIGLEMAEALTKRGMKVSLVEMMPHVMNIMDAEFAGFIQREMLSYGVSIHTQTAVTAIENNKVILNDKSKIDADLVLMSIGVKPTLKLAEIAGLAIGDAGGLLVDNHLQTSDPNIYAAGDMIELEHRVMNKKVRIPLAGPANRQGRIAAENAMGGDHFYKGSIGTSIVRVFEAVAGITGLSLKAALKSGFDADAIVVHKENHTTYYPGAEMVDIQIVYDKKSGVILGAQTSGYDGADRRLDVLATAVANGLTVADLADVDFAYSPPLGNANDAINMAAYVAENKMSGFTRTMTVGELDAYIAGKSVVWIDLRDIFTYQKASIQGANNVPIEMIQTVIDQVEKDQLIVLYDQTGKKGHQALRTLVGRGFTDVVNVSGGFISLSHHAWAIKPENFTINQPKIERKVVGDNKHEVLTKTDTQAITSGGLLIIDVRTPSEFASGAVPNAINMPLDKLQSDIQSVTDKHREIIVYCASGARSGYAQQMLSQIGYTNVENGGGVMRMMQRFNQ